MDLLVIQVLQILVDGWTRSISKNFWIFSNSTFMPPSIFLLVLDNHESHLSITGLDFCKVNGIIMLSLPPHCFHKLQPLDRTVYGSLKKAVNSQCDSWMTANPGRTMTIYDIPGIIRKALSRAATYNNIVSDFECTEISPFNKNTFQDLEFLPSSVTDRDNPVLLNSFATSENDEILHLLSTSAASVTLETINEPIASSSPRHPSKQIDRRLRVDWQQKLRRSYSTVIRSLQTLLSFYKSVRIQWWEVESELSSVFPPSTHAHRDAACSCELRAARTDKRRFCVHEWNEKNAG